MASDSGASLFPQSERGAPQRFTTGLLPCQAIRAFVAAGHIRSDEPIEERQIQPASLDLRLGPVAWRVRASFLPGRNASVRDKLDRLGMHEIDLSKGAVLERGCVYIVPLLEEIHLPAHYSAAASPKSSTGRLDVFTRLIRDYGTEFDALPERFKGRPCIEISPRTFSILVRKGDALNQLRIRRGSPPPADAALERLHSREPLVYAENERPGEAHIRKGLWVSIDLKGTGEGPVGYRAKKHAALIDVSRIGHYDPADFWEPLFPSRDHTLVLDPDDFYILVSKERVSVPPDYAAEMVAYDTSLGEYRVHYAGFFDPGFGYGAEAKTGTPAVLEVRSHEVPFLLEDGQVAARLLYERLIEAPERTYGEHIGSFYQGQGLTLGKQFRRPPLTPPCR